MLDWIIDHFFSVVMLPVFLIGWLGMSTVLWALFPKWLWSTKRTLWHGVFFVITLPMTLITLIIEIRRYFKCHQ